MKYLSIVLIAVMTQLTAHSAKGAINKDKVSVAESRKTEHYVSKGVYVGGDWAVDTITIKDIRYAKNAKFERVVIDLENTIDNKKTALDRPPYYHVGISPNYKRAVISILGKTQLSFDPKKVIASFKKSDLISRVDLLPKIETDRWAFVLQCRKECKTEVFELSQPSRIILDFKK